MCPTHILVHRTPPLRGEFTVLGQGGDTSGGEYSHLRGGYINPCLGLMYDAAYAESRNKDFLTF